MNKLDKTQKSMKGQILNIKLIGRLKKKTSARVQNLGMLNNIYHH